MAKHKGPTNVAVKSDTTKKLKQVVAKGKVGRGKISPKIAGNFNATNVKLQPTDIDHRWFVN